MQIYFIRTKNHASKPMGVSSTNFISLYLSPKAGHFASYQSDDDFIKTEENDIKSEHLF